MKELQLRIERLTNQIIEARIRGDILVVLDLELQLDEVIKNG